MYDRQILADHFNGKRPADDPEVQSQFRLLRRTAEIDYNAMYGGKDRSKCADTRTTVDSIEEDYIYHVKSIARTQRSMKKVKLIAGLVVLAIALVYLLVSK
jgi:hypothetical protein